MEFKAFAARASANLFKEMEMDSNVFVKNMMRGVLVLAVVIFAVVVISRLSEWNRIQAYKKTVDSLANTTTPEGQYYLALSYQLDQDFDGSRQWLRKSAEQGCLDALFLLPEYYSSESTFGNACGADEIECYAWLGVLANHVPGCYVGTANQQEQIRMNRETLERQQALNLSENQLEMAKSKEAEYISKYGCGTKQG